MRHIGSICSCVVGAAGKGDDESGNHYYILHENKPEQNKLMMPLSTVIHLISQILLDKGQK